MAQAASPLDVRTPSDPLDAILALCSSARPEPGGPEARELSRLLAAASRAGGPFARLRIERDLATADWLARPWTMDASDPANPSTRAQDERRLVTKLAASGRLRPELLLSALAADRAPLFYATLAALAAVDALKLEVSLAGSPERLALALRAAGVDRSVFGTVLAHLGSVYDVGGSAGVGSEAVGAALRLAPAEAGARLHAAVAG